MYRKSLIAVFRDIFASTNKIFILAGGWALDYHSMKFRHSPNISQVPKILSLKAFGNSRGNLYIRCLKAITAHRFTCGERKI